MEVIYDFYVIKHQFYFLIKLNTSNIELSKYHSNIQKR